MLDDYELSDLSSYTSDDSIKHEDYKSNNQLKSVQENISNDAQPELRPLKSISSKYMDESPGNGTGPLKFESQYIVEDEALTVKISPDRSAFAVGLSNGTIRVFFMNKKLNDITVQKLKAPKEMLPCNALAFTSCKSCSNSTYYQHLLAVYSSGYIRLWNCLDGIASRLIFEIFESSIPCDFNKVQDETEEPNELLCLSISLDDSRFVTGGSDTIIKVYDIFTKTRLASLIPSQKTGLKRPYNYHTNRISALLYHPRGDSDSLYSHIFVSASWDNTIQIWNDRIPGSLWYYYGPHIVGSDGLDIDPNRNLILSSSWLRSRILIQMWKFADFAVSGGVSNAKRRSRINYSNPVNEFSLEGTESHTQGYVARFGEGGHLIFYTGFNQNILRVIETEEMRTVAGVNNLPSAVYSLDSCFDPTDRRRCVIVFTNTTNIYQASFLVETSDSNLSD